MLFPFHCTKIDNHFFVAVALRRWITVKKKETQTHNWQLSSRSHIRMEPHSIFLFTVCSCKSRSSSEKKRNINFLCVSLVCKDHLSETFYSLPHGFLASWIFISTTFRRGRFIQLLKRHEQFIHFFNIEFYFIKIFIQMGREILCTYQHSNKSRGSLACYIKD